MQEETRRLVSTEDLNATGCIRMIAQCIVNALETNHKDTQKGAEELERFAEHEIIEHFCSVAEIDEERVRKAIRNRAHELRTGKKVPSRKFDYERTKAQGRLGKKTDPTWQYGNHTCCGAWTWWRHKASCPLQDQDGKLPPG